MSSSESDKSESKSESESDNNETKDNINLEEFFKRSELLLYKRINRYYRDKCSEENIKKMINIVNGKSDISLRILDWFVTKYSKKRSEKIVIENNIKYYDVRIDYKAVLKGYKKRNFDPFRRRKKFIYYFDKENNIKLETTLGQLNFFQWAISNKIIDCVEKNVEFLAKEMNSSNKEEKERKKIKTDIENKQPVVIKKSSADMNNISLTVTFD